MSAIPKPTPGRIVLYTSKIDNGPGNDVVSPAVILRTRDTTVGAVIDRWGPEPRTVESASDPSVTHETTARPDNVIRDLPNDATVDLLVHGLGRDYREYAVPYGRGPGTWAYPEPSREVIDAQSGGRMVVGPPAAQDSSEPYYPSGRRFAQADLVIRDGVVLKDRNKIMADPGTYYLRFCEEQ